MALWEPNIRQPFDNPSRSVTFMVASGWQGRTEAACTHHSLSGAPAVLSIVPILIELTIDTLEQ